MVQGQEGFCAGTALNCRRQFRSASSGIAAVGVETAVCCLHALRLAPSAAQFDNVVYGRSAIDDAYVGEVSVIDVVDTDMTSPFPAKCRARAFIAGAWVLHDLVGIENLANRCPIFAADADDLAFCLLANDRAAHEPRVADASGSYGDGAQHGDAGDGERNFGLELHFRSPCVKVVVRLSGTRDYGPYSRFYIRNVPKVAKLRKPPN